MTRQMEFFFESSKAVFKFIQLFFFLFRESNTKMLVRKVLEYRDLVDSLDLSIGERHGNVPNNCSDVQYSIYCFTLKNIFEKNNFPCFFWF